MIKKYIRYQIRFQHKDWTDNYGNMVHGKYDLEFSNEVRYCLSLRLLIDTYNEFKNNSKYENVRIIECFDGEEEISLEEFKTKI